MTKISISTMFSVINEEQLNSNNSMDQLSDSYEESGRGCRNKKKQMDPTCCPICSCTLRISELNSHLTLEIEKLSKLTLHKQRRSPKITSPVSGPSKSSDFAEKSWDNYQKVKANRQGRLKLKSKKRKTDEITCPVCNKVTSEDITLHVEMCLQRMDTNTNESISDDDIDVEGDDGKFEEYEWAGQTRVRASSLLEGGFAGLGMGTSISKSTPEDEDTEVNIDGDDSQIFGVSHYTEQDLLNISTEEHSRAIDAHMKTEEHTRTIDADMKTEEDLSELSKTVVIDSLKMKIRELEERDQIKEQYKCLICMGRYVTPVVSVCCWHVHCEKCWLKTLAAKKICPQCNMITSPAELRRIYI